MTRIVTGTDWTEAEIQQFWDHESTRPDAQSPYFSRLNGAAIVRFLELRGLIRGDVLDFGCGPGYLLPGLATNSQAVFGVDSSVRSIEQARVRCAALPNLGGLEVCHAADPWPLTQTQFDLIVCLETLEHMRSEQAVELLTALSNRLKPGGHLLVTVPHAEDLSASNVYCPFCDTQFHRWQHLRSISMAQLAQEIRGAELEPVELVAVDIREFLPELATPHNPRQTNWRRRLAWNLLPLLRWLSGSMALRLEQRLRTFAGANLCAIARRVV